MTEIVIPCVTSFLVTSDSFIYPPFSHFVSSSNYICLNSASTCNLKLFLDKWSLRRAPSTVASKVSLGFCLRCILTAMRKLSLYLLRVLKLGVKKIILSLGSNSSKTTVILTLFLFIYSFNKFAATICFLN